MKELDLTTVERIERFIVFEGAVRLLHWEDTSSHGFKIKLGLKSRAELDHFDSTMKRRKHRGGQRYHMILYTAMMEPEQMESQFCGRGWAESLGAHVALHIPGLSDQRWWREQKTHDQEGECSTWNIMLMEIGDDEIIIDQTMRDKAEQAPKGGPRSKAVAMRLQDPEFIDWLFRRSIYRRPDAAPCSFVTVDKIMKEVCNIKSKIEFDNNGDAAWEIWENQFHRPFIQYMQHGKT